MLDQIHCPMGMSLYLMVSLGGSNSMALMFLRLRMLVSVLSADFRLL